MHGVSLRILDLVLGEDAGLVFGYRELHLATDRVQLVYPLDLDPDLQATKLGRDTAVEGKEANLVGVVQTEVDGVFVVRRRNEAEDSILRDTEILMV